MRIQAIILKKIPVREYDELVVCYTKHAGKQTYRAKSVRRHTSKQASHLDLLNWADFDLVHSKNSPDESAGNGHPIITSAESLATFSNLKSSLPALAAAYFILECFDRLVFDGETDKKLWDFLTSKLGELDRFAGNNNADWPKITLASKEEFLDVLGYDSSVSVEELAGMRFRSLQFLKKVVG